VRNLPAGAVLTPGAGNFGTVASLPHGATASQGAAFSYDSNTRVLNLTSGTITFAEDLGDLTSPGVAITASGATSNLVFASTTQHLAGLTLTGGARTTVSARDLSGSPRPPAHVLVVAGLTVDADSTLDLRNNDLVRQYAAEQGSAALDSVRALITRGFNSGDFLGTGISSGDAADDASVNGFVGLGYADNAELGYTSFDGRQRSDGQ